MAPVLSLDTSFLIDLERERPGGDGSAHRFLRADPSVELCLSAVALVYGALSRPLRVAGRLIGSNDLWIAATSLRYGLPLVGANVEHFRRVEALQVVSYR